MSDICFECLKILVMVAVLVLTRYVLPWVKSKVDSEKLNLVAQWAYKAVLMAQQTMKATGGKEKKASVTQFLKELLPDPSTLGPRTVCKTNIGCIFTGVKDGKEKTIYIYNVCDHQECYKEVGSQAISYTTGVPAMIGVMMVVTGAWKKDGVINVEEFDPDPFMDALNKWGLPWQVCEDPQIVE